MDVARTYQTVNQAELLLREERRSGPTFDLSPRRRLWLYRRGFLSKSDVLYDLESNDHREYLTDFQRYVRTKRIDGVWTIVLDNKLAFHSLLGEFPSHRPAVYGLLSGGSAHVFDRDDERAGVDGGPDDFAVAPSERSADREGTKHAVDWIDERLTHDEKLVLKWFSGGGGENVSIVERTDGRYLIDGEPMERAAFATRIANLENYLVCEFVDQAEYIADIFPDATNTIRAITMYDERSREAFVPMAIHRIGMPRTAPADNFSTGGLSAEIDLETGRLGSAAEYPVDGELRWHDAHPHTGARIDGRSVPGWDRIREQLCSIARTFSHIPYVGWDLVVTDDGEFQIIEANSYPGVTSMQAHRPLLADERTRRFYRDHGVV